eukprot:tig00021522_g22108.t1
MRPAFCLPLPAAPERSLRHSGRESNRSATRINASGSVGAAHFAKARRQLRDAYGPAHDAALRRRVGFEAVASAEQPTDDQSKLLTGQSSEPTIEATADGRAAFGANGLDVPALWLGCWKMGKRSWGSPVEDDDSRQAIKAAMHANVNAFDTCEVYGDGHSERLLAESLRGIHRDRYFLATSVFCKNLRPAARARARARAPEIVRACERSLANLDTDHVDLYYIQTPAGSFGSEEVPLCDSLEALASLRDRGLARGIGLANYDLNDLTLAQSWTPLDALYVPRSLFWRSAETFLLPFARQHGIPTVQFSPLAQGLLAGEFRDPEFQYEPTDPDIRQWNKLFRHRESWERAQKALPQLQEMAGDMGVSIAQLALAWLLHQRDSTLPHPPRAVFGSANARHVTENAAAVELKLNERDLEELHRPRALTPRPPGPARAPHWP